MADINQWFVDKGPTVKQEKDSNMYKFTLSQAKATHLSNESNHTSTVVELDLYDAESKIRTAAKDGTYQTKVTPKNKESIEPLKKELTEMGYQYELVGNDFHVTWKR